MNLLSEKKRSDLFVKVLAISYNSASVILICLKLLFDSKGNPESKIDFLKKNFFFSSMIQSLDSGRGFGHLPKYKLQSDLGTTVVVKTFAFFFFFFF